jgi:choline monooxygenase
MLTFSIQPDIRHAATLPGWFYKSAAVFEQVKEKIFAATWLYAADAAAVAEPMSVYPVTLLQGVLDEPLVFTKDSDGNPHCLSNVCTHRGKIIVEQAGKNRMLTCGYHGRCFRLDGSYKSMPEFEEVANFPSPADDLTRVPFAEWLGMLFVSLNPVVSFADLIRPIQERLSWMPLETLTFNAESSRDYLVNANWALYCDNYLEGFHIPFVHPALNQALDFDSYGYEIFDYCNLQLGIAKDDQPVFDIPPGAPDFGRKIYAYYYWLFPNLMLNFYPWGLSLNVVEPLSHQRTRIRFRTYYFGNTIFNREINRIDQTELEDEAVVESVQRGLQSRFYHSGRFSPTQEQGVHHFHGLVAKFIKE